ncbi:hypothetical protein GF359_09090 [candidate division WOR-3 bacterium]|uniref:Uncharacterized protein n=1 Tax=candidate division WOR-3 bacterium TaxID=2052148 RepID=A0A9D5QD46_UNCW3|nr:hypothetical protein [candidate division WOR-3 bacterium]MBD3365353.1 hypothetical protein [candidate division WOR-3 bacterium]
MSNQKPEGDKIIDALERLGFEVAEEEHDKVTLKNYKQEVTVPKGEIPAEKEKKVARKLEPIFDAYSNVPLARKLERIKEWVEETVEVS